MNDLWTRIKVWTKTIVGLLVLAYVVLFVLKNSDQTVTVWYFINHKADTSKLVLILVTFGAGVLAALLARTVLKTLRQIRQYRQRARAERLAREMEQIKRKAAMIQHKTTAPTPPPPGGPAGT